VPFKGTAETYDWAYLTGRRLIYAATRCKTRWEREPVRALEKLAIRTAVHGGHSPCSAGRRGLPDFAISIGGPGRAKGQPKPIIRQDHMPSGENLIRSDTKCKSRTDRNYPVTSSPEAIL